MTTERRVLVTDDDAGIRRLLVTVLIRAGYLVDSASDGAEAIEKVSNTDYNAILLDLMMPRVNGFEVVEHLERTQPGLARHCVIVLTAASNQDLTRLDTPTVFRVMRKPFEMSELLSVLRDCTGQDEIQ
jgi:CheY-like chemotaxis protein